MADSAQMIVPGELPDVITTYLKARQAGDIDLAVASYTPDASVTDEGQTRTGRDEIRSWLTHSASEFTYTVELVGATKIDDDHFDLKQHLEGNFPGGQVDLHFRFVLRDGLITQLVIEE